MITVEDLSQLSILLVEDEKIIKMTIRMSLEKMQCKVDLAETGKEALEKDFTQYNLILMDIGLPDMRGTEVTAEIRKNEKDSRTPIVAVTGYVASDVQAECDSAGIDEIYNKPLFGDQLKEVLLKHARLTK